jgi:hypothetical protein
MIYPTVHLNGTSRNQLVEQYTSAYIALGDAVRVMCDNGPNGRDYYLQGPDAITTALAEHSARVDKIREVMAELMAIAERVAA